MANFDFKDLKVLFFDDSLQIRALIRNCLMAFGIKDIVEATDAKTGFQEMVDSDPDLVITDWNMPAGDGIDLIHLIRHSPDSPNHYVPIIMLTGYSELERVETARDVGVSSFLAKPMSADSLYRRLVSLVEDQRLFIRCENFFGPDRRFKVSETLEGPERRG